MASVVYIQAGVNCIGHLKCCSMDEGIGDSRWKKYNHPPQTEPDGTSAIDAGIEGVSRRFSMAGLVVPPRSRSDGTNILDAWI